ncbi:MAG: hypothetical protein ND866_30360 [Pyrinomonadaceae bacterium]|nr:hypothetical protein [Pyrinomonadaceae bacterium]
MIHIPAYWPLDASDYTIRYMVELLLACLDSYFTHENEYDLLVTTNDERPLEVVSAYKEKSGHRFELRFVSRDELLSTFSTDESRLMDSPCMKTVFSKFYPILNQECDAIVHLDYDTMFVSKVDLRPLLLSDIGLVDANQFRRDAGLWCPTVEQADFFRIGQSVEPVSIWINSGVFSVQRAAFDICRTEIGYYLENLERAIAGGLNVYPDELIMNALAVRERGAVKVIPDYRYNFLAYYLKYDPSWTWRGQIVHFHSLKPYDYWYSEGAVVSRCDATLRGLLNEDLYLAVLMWCRHLHVACRQLAFEFPMLEAMPIQVVERELARLNSERDGA